MSIERGRKGEIPSYIYNNAYKELVGLARMVPKSGSIELSALIDKSHPTLMKILNEFPQTTVHDLGGQPVLNVVGISKQQ